MAVKNGVSLFLVTVLAWIQTGGTFALVAFAALNLLSIQCRKPHCGTHASIETVWLKDLTTKFQTEKRIQGDLDLPDELTFHLRRMSGDLTLNLKRNHGIDPNADIYMSRITKDGRYVLVKERNLEKSDVAYYQDVENYAFMTVRCVKRSNEQCDRVINGNIYIGDRNYDIRPAETEVTSRNVLEVRGRFGKRYILQDQPYIIIDAANAEEEILPLSQRFQEQHKQIHFFPSDVMLTSTNQTVANNRATDKTRQPRSSYYVKVAVLIDHGLWNLYSSLVHSLNPVTRSSKVKEKIRQSFSHIMNGVDLRYRRIQDQSISIKVILSKFVYFKRTNDFSFFNSKVILVNGTQYIDVVPYLMDVLMWDNEIGRKLSPVFSTAVLFTRYQLYHTVLNKLAAGLSYQGEVCKFGKRSVIIQASDYLSTSLSAAHEIGHVLGSGHDGDPGFDNCRADDYFIMTPTGPAANPSVPYPRNLWTFSRCSVDAFKRTLRTKECIKTPGNFYDEREHAGYVMHEPGQVYGLDHQCHIINGHGSVYCGIVPLNMCYLKCTDPKTRIWSGIYHHAARGTQCGNNMAQNAASLTQ